MRIRDTILVLMVGAGAMTAAANERNAWYWDSVVNLHIDNHSGLVGKGHTVDELVEMVRPIDVSMVQVSALGSNGMPTFATELWPRQDLDGWDTPAVWKQVAERLDRRFGIYINTRGLQLHTRHPDWVQLNAQGKGKGRNNGLDICMRPSSDGTGALEAYFLPLLREICTRYQPDAIWVDGDHARTHVCYCRHCKAAWKAETGKAEPPTSPDDPDWARWATLEQARDDAYRRQMGELIHTLAPHCMYTSNHSWRFRAKDPRCAPPWADTLSGDLSHGNALLHTRVSGLQLSPEESLPYDIMHNIRSISSAPASADRVCQQGALTLACGGAWFLWSPGSAIVQPQIQERARLCADFAQVRREVLGRTQSMSQIAVLLSETSWARTRMLGDSDAYAPESAEHVALALQDWRYCVDMPNEEILEQRLDAYRTVIVAGQRALSPGLLEKLRAYAAGGGQVLLLGGAAAGPGSPPEDIAAGLTGVARTEYVDESVRVQHAGGWLHAPGYWRLNPSESEVLLRFPNGDPLLTRRSVGEGWIAVCALNSVSYPDPNGGMFWLMRALGIGPSVVVSGDAGDRNLTFAVRRRDRDLVVHVCDLTSYAGEERVWPGETNDIKAGDPAALTFEIPLPERPSALSAVPESAGLAWQWENGMLSVTLRNARIHTAVCVRGNLPSRLPYHAADTEVSRPWYASQTTALDFEDLSVRTTELPTRIGRAHTDPLTEIRVTARTAASGTRSLKFVDHPDAKHDFLPYLVLSPKDFFAGTACMSFDLRLDPEAAVRVELRETGNAWDFPVGPSVLFSAADGVVAEPDADPLPFDLPVGAWFHVDLLAPLASGRPYELWIETADGRKKRFAGLRTRSPDFHICRWIGFIGDERNNGTFYVDNLRIARLDDPESFESPGLPPQAAAATGPRARDAALAWWRFDEGQGSIAADAAGGNTGDVGATWTEGKKGKAILCNGKPGSNVLVEDSPQLRFGTGDFSLAFWIRPDDLSSPKGYRRCLEKSAFPHTWWNVDILADGRVELEMGDADGQSGTTRSEGRIPVGAWTHVAISVDRQAETVTYYIGGRRDCVKNLPEDFDGALDVRGRDLFIGGAHFGLNGAMDEVKVLRRTLTRNDLLDWAEE
jgi:hypothetical protein